MKIFSLCAVALVASASSIALGAVPATPTLTAGAEFKGLRFDWEPVAGASWYQLEYRPHQTSSFAQTGDDLPATATSTGFSLPLHLYDWTYARYRLAACNSSGCSRSAEISVSGLRRYAVGYFKPSRTLINLHFGDDTDLSPDGTRFVAASPGDTISVNGSARPGGAVYLFTRRSDGSWSRRARLEPPVPPYSDGYNIMRVAVSGDGNVIALAMPNYLHEEFDAKAGEVFVLRWDGARWNRTRITQRANAGVFGKWVQLNTTGNTLVVGLANSPNYDAVVYNYGQHGSTAGWAATKYIPWAHLVDTDSCSDGALSRDGALLFRACYRRVAEDPDDQRPGTYIHVWPLRDVGDWEFPLTLRAENTLPYYATGGLAVSQDGGTIAAQVYVPSGSNTATHASRVSMFKRTGNVWYPITQLAPGSWRNAAGEDAYGRRIAMNGDGTTLAVSDVLDNGTGTGPRAAPLNAGTQDTGAVYIYRLSSQWKLANMVKANTTGTSSRHFGVEVALSQTGKTLIIGDPFDSSKAQGIGGNWNNREAPQSGAVWMY